MYPGTGGSGQSGTCRERAEDWSVWGGGAMHPLEVPTAPMRFQGVFGDRCKPLPGWVSLHREGSLDVHCVPLVFKHAIAQGHLHWEQGSDAGGVVVPPGWLFPRQTHPWAKDTCLCPPGDEVHREDLQLLTRQSRCVPSKSRISDLKESISQADLC